MAFLDTLFRYGGLRELTLTDANTTLSADDAGARVIKFVGTLTANRTITFPHQDGGDWLVYNATTGGYTLTLAGAQGAGTVSLANGSREYVYYDSSGGLFSAVVYDSSDLDAVGSTQGQVLYRGSSAWSALAVGTSGQYLTTGGAGANPSWTGGVSRATVTTTDSAGSSGQIVFCHDSINGQWLYDGSVWWPIVGGRLGVKTPTSGWTATNISGSGTTDTGFGAVEIQEASNGSADNWRYLRRNVGSNTDWRCAFRAATVGSTLYTAIGFRLASSGKMVVLSLIRSASSGGADPGQCFIQVGRYDNDTTLNSNPYSLEIGSVGDPVWFRIATSGTNMLFYYSADSFNYFLLHTEPNATHLGSAPDEVLFGVNPYDGAAHAAALSWYEV